ncbi:MAG TPA: hypothetical protein VFS76_26625 [Pyrinomonadaceae bacterium]|nr:hypothetical protein [Pyrinomonadaceae bacterium]
MRIIFLILLISGTTLANQSQRVSLVRSPRTLALAHAFKSGKLPEPARLPKGSIDQQAAALAKAVATGDESATASLYAAILAAGYGVRDTDKSVMQTTEHGQGLIFESAEVAAMSKLYGEDYGVTLDHLAQSFTRSVPQFKDLPLANKLLEGIRNAAKSNHAATRFWAQFIIELGKNSAIPYDLSLQVDATKTRLDAIQVALIMSRLTGDLAVAEKRTAAHHPRPALSSCGGGDVQDLILDYNALASTTLFGFLANRMGGGVENYGNVAGLANVVLTVFKFIISYASLEVEITMDGDKLVRTKTNRPGEQRTLTAKLKMDPGKWEKINCLRPLLNAAGLDVDVPGGGPLSGVNVVWVMVLGGDSRGWVGTVEDIFKIMGGEASWGDGIVFFDPLPGADRSPAKQITNGEGESQIRVVGVPQQTDLSKRKLFELVKGAGVRVDVQLKPMRIVDKQQGLSNLMDVVGNAFSFLTKDPLGGAVGTVTETMYRSNWYSSQPFYFIVKDWEPCKGQWQGTITYKVFSKKEGTAESVSNTSYWNETAYYEARAQLDGTKDNLGSPIARVEAHASEVKEWGGQGKGACYGKSDQAQSVRGHTNENTTAFSISVNPRTRQYSVSAPTPVVIGSGEYSITMAKQGACNNQFNKGFTRSSKLENYKLSDDAPNLIGQGLIDPANPDEISGTDSTEHVTVGGVKKTVTITWSLRRCADQ